jgi:hypothetical protein
MIMPATDVGLSCPPVAERHAFWVVIATVVESEATDTIAVLVAWRAARGCWVGEGLPKAYGGT